MAFALFGLHSRVLDLLQEDTEFIGYNINSNSACPKYPHPNAKNNVVYSMQSFTEKEMCQMLYAEQYIDIDISIGTKNGLLHRATAR